MLADILTSQGTVLQPVKIKSTFTNRQLLQLCEEQKKNYALHIFYQINIYCENQTQNKKVGFETRQNIETVMSISNQCMPGREFIFVNC